MKLRLLTRSEYENALTDLLGVISTPLELPADAAVAGFVSVGASEVSVGSSAVSLYEAASGAATAEVFCGRGALAEARGLPTTSGSE